MSISINTVKTESFEMDYFRFGKEGARPVVILPGLSIKSVMPQADAVAAQYSLLAEHYDIYLIDRRKVVPDKYTVEEMAEDTVQAIKMIGLESIDIVGISQGGMIAQTIAIRYPDLIHAMILGSSASRLPEKKDSLGKWKDFAKEGKATELVRAFAEDIYSPRFYEKYKDRIAATYKDISEDELRKFMILSEGTNGFDVYEDIAKIKCPTLVIGAAEDRVTGIQAAIDTAERIGCELYIYEGYGHAVYDEAPNYVERLKEFFDRH